MPEQNQQGLTPEEQQWNEWLQNPCTKKLRAWASVRRNDLMEIWASGGFSAAFTTEMAVKNAGATGACSVFADIQELDFSHIYLGASDEAPVSKE